MEKKKELENRMGKFVRDFRIYTETSGSVDYKVLRNGLRMFIQAELDRAREEGKREALEQIQRFVEDEMLVITRDGTDILEKYIKEWLSKLTTK